MKNPVGLSWIFSIENGDSYRVYGNSDKLLYQLTNDNLVITARKEAKEGDSVTIVKGDNIYTYTLAIGYEINTGTTTVYYGSSSTVPTSLPTGSGHQLAVDEYSVTIKADQKCAWLALPSTWKVTDWRETTFGTALKDVKQESMGDYTLWYDTTSVDLPINNTLKITFTK